MLRRKPKAEPSASEIEAAVCIEEFRTGAVGVLIPRWQRRAVDDPLVRAYPEFFRGLVRLDEEVNEDGK